MKYIKTTITIICLISISLGLFAQKGYKIVDRSSRRVPSWVNGVEEGFIIVSATSSDIEDAKSKCLDAVKIQVIESIGINIKHETGRTTSETITNNSDAVYSDEYSANFKTRAASLPFVSSISFNSVSEYYWEKIRHKSSKKEEYVYSIKYPFSKIQMHQMIDTFNEQDKQQEKKLNKLQDKFDNLSSVEEIDIAISELKALEKYFFDEVRLERTKSLKSNFQDVYKDLSITRISNKLGEEEYALVYGSRIIAYSKAPKISSKTVSEISPIMKGDKWVVKYNYSTAYPDDENYLDVKWIINGRSIKDRFYINLDYNNVNIAPKGTLVLTCNENEEGDIESVKMNMMLNAQGVANVTIEKIEIKNEFSHTGFTFDNIAKEINTKGTYNIEAEANSGFKIRETKGVINPLSIGVMTIKTSNSKTVLIDFSIMTEFNKIK